MRKSILLLIVAFVLALSTNAQTPATKLVPVAVKDTVINKVSHKLYVGARGGRYIVVTSKTGNVYKRYLKN